tara:strand:+ start:412 stop:996 length:585 start_codon:yes stop_codon:yes gene_type:complete
MSAYLSSNDVLNALSTYFHESNKKGYLRSSYELSIYESIKNDKRHSTDTEAADIAQNVVNLDYKLTYQSNKTHTIAVLVFDQLLKENKNSLKALYPDSPDMWQNNYKFKPSQQVINWLLNRDIKGLASLADMCRGYYYQSCEHSGFKTSPAYFLIKDIQNSLLNNLVKFSLSNEEQPWANWSEPKTDIKTICLT